MGSFAHGLSLNSNARDPMTRRRQTPVRLLYDASKAGPMRASDGDDANPVTKAAHASARTTVPRLA
jgi:hypothetical protein